MGKHDKSKPIKKVTKLQDKAIYLLDHLKDTKPIYLDYKIPNLEKLIRIEQQKFAYRLIKDLLPVNLAKLVRTDHKGSNLLKTHKYSTRFKAELTYQPPRVLNTIVASYISISKCSVHYPLI